MVIGHLAPAIAVRVRYAEVPVTALLAATFLPDLAEAALTAAGSGGIAAAAYSHSVPLVAVLSLTIALGLRLRGARNAASLAVFALSLSHIPLDWITGETKPLFFATGPVVGLRLYRYPALDWLVESALCVAAWAWWSTRQRGKDVAWGGLVLVSLLVFQGVLISYTASHSITFLLQRALAAIPARSIL